MSAENVGPQSWTPSTSLRSSTRFDHCIFSLNDAFSAPDILRHSSKHSFFEYPVPRSARRASENCETFRAVADVQPPLACKPFALKRSYLLSNVRVIDGTRSPSIDSSETSPPHHDNVQNVCFPHGAFHENVAVIHATPSSKHKSQGPTKRPLTAFRR